MLTPEDVERIRRSLCMSPSLGADQARRLLDTVVELLAEVARRDEQGCCLEEEGRGQ